MMSPFLGVILSLFQDLVRSRGHAKIATSPKAPRNDEKGKDLLRVFPHGHCERSEAISSNLALSS